MLIARSTPAQQPRGLARRTSIAAYSSAFARRRVGRRRAWRSFAGGGGGASAARCGAGGQERRLEARACPPPLPQGTAVSAPLVAAVARGGGERPAREPRGDAFQARRSHAN